MQDGIEIWFAMHMDRHMANWEDMRYTIPSLAALSTAV